MTSAVPQPAAPPAAPLAAPPQALPPDVSYQAPPGMQPVPDLALMYAEPDKVSQFFTRVGRRTPRWVAPAVVAGTCVAACGYVLWANPTDGGAADIPGCLVRLTTGFDCPGCGGTRAAWYLLHGDIGAAAQHHLVFAFAVPFLIYAYVAWAAGVFFNKRLPKLRLSFRTIGVALAIWAVWSVLRNLPFEPFTLFYV